MTRHRLNSYVLSLVSLADDDGEICAPGDRGEVVHLESDGVPLVRFERTGRASIVDPDSEVVRTRGRACADA
jgi:hypothetical protein